MLEQIIKNYYGYQKTAYLEVGSILRAARKAKKLTQIDLASYLGITNQTVNNWEHGRSIPTLEQAQKLSKIL